MHNLHKHAILHLGHLLSKNYNTINLFWKQMQQYLQSTDVLNLVLKEWHMSLFIYLCFIS